MQLCGFDERRALEKPTLDRRQHAPSGRAEWGVLWLGTAEALRLRGPTSMESARPGKSQLLQGPSRLRVTARKRREIVNDPTALAVFYSPNDPKNEWSDFGNRRGYQSVRFCEERAGRSAASFITRDQCQKPRNA
ncbi:hypothetical protein M0804_006251 [Polistes exclamans]|nr:hypothetical protein M0804_006251 [Polistes exclamans]